MIPNDRRQLFPARVNQTIQTRCFIRLTTMLLRELLQQNQVVIVAQLAG